jgi:RNA polymerase sigma-70 factor (ECF subfamily)
VPSPDLLSQLVQLFEVKQKELDVAALSITRDRASAEDVVLDAMLAVSELKQGPDDLLAYLYRTVRNKALHSTKQAKRFTSDSEYSSFIDYNSQAAEEQIFVKQILRQLEKLESNQQQVLIMKLFGDLTFDEIAEITSNSPNTVASWYRRGLLKLKESIHEPAL